MTSLLLDYQADPNIPTQIEGQTPFHYAVQYGHIECVELMLHYKADIHFKDAKNNSAIEIAKDQSMKEILLTKVEEPPKLDESPKLEESPNPFLGTFGAEPYKVTQKDFQLKPLYEWLWKQNLPELYNNLVDAGYDDIRSMVQQMLSPLPITEERLSKIGISKPGHRRKLVLKLQEEAAMDPKKGLKKFPMLLKCCTAPNNTGGLSNVPSLLQWLDDMNLAFLITKFEEAGYEDIECMVLMMMTPTPITQSILENEIQIDDVRYRDIILEKLKNDARQLNSKTPLFYEEPKSEACNPCVVM